MDWSTLAACSQLPSVVHLTLERLALGSLVVCRPGIHPNRDASHVADSHGGAEMFHKPTREPSSPTDLARSRSAKRIHPVFRGDPGKWHVGRRFLVGRTSILQCT